MESLIIVILLLVVMGLGFYAFYTMFIMPKKQNDTVYVAGADTNYLPGNGWWPWLTGWYGGPYYGTGYYGNWNRWQGGWGTHGGRSGGGGWGGGGTHGGGGHR